MAKLDKSKYDSTAVESVAPINVNTHPDEPWLNPVWRVVNGATIADKILADGEHEVITALKLGELASTKMVPDNRMQERFDRFLAKCSDKERVIANFDLGKALGTDAETVYCRYFPQIGEAANDNEPAVKLTPPPLPKMHPEPNTPQAAGGLLCEMSEWITSTAIIPVPELSLAASNTLLCGMFGDRALTPLGGGINMYMVTVMRAAAGKGHAPKMITRLANAVGKPGAVSNGDPTSYAAIERMLRNNISTAMIMDEYGETLQEVNSHQKNSAAASI